VRSLDTCPYEPGNIYGLVVVVGFSGQPSTLESERCLGVWTTGHRDNRRVFLRLGLRLKLRRELLGF